MSYLPVITIDPDTQRVTINDNGLVITTGPDRHLEARLQFATGAYVFDTDETPSRQSPQGDARLPSESPDGQETWYDKTRRAVEALGFDPNRMTQEPRP